jgi:hypothetical protein
MRLRPAPPQMHMLRRDLQLETLSALLNNNVDCYNQSLEFTEHVQVRWGKAGRRAGAADAGLSKGRRWRGRGPGAAGAWGAGAAAAGGRPCCLTPHPLLPSPRPCPAPNPGAAGGAVQGADRCGGGVQGLPGGGQVCCQAHRGPHVPGGVCVWRDGGWGGGGMAEAGRALQGLGLGWGWAVIRCALAPLGWA